MEQQLQQPEKFETIDVDLTEDNIHSIITTWLYLHMSPPSYDVFLTTKGNFQERVYATILNESCIHAIELAIENTNQSQEPTKRKTL